MTRVPFPDPRLHFAPLDPGFACCPRCGGLCPRHERVTLHQWHGHLDAEQQRVFVVGAYLCEDCPPGRRWFRLAPPGYDDGSHYSAATRLTLVALVSLHNLTFEAAASFGRTFLHLPLLQDTTVRRWFLEQGEAFDYPDHLAQCLERFSGQLAVDELYEGRWHVLRVTDPLNDLEITSWLGEDAPTGDDVVALFTELNDAGFQPDLVVTDGSSLYPTAVTEVWPEADHQRCVFHFLMWANKRLARAFWQAYNAMPKPPKRKRGRPKKRGRPRKDHLKRTNRRKVRAVRYLLFKREGDDEQGRPLLSNEERRAVDEALRLCPDLVVVRDFVCALYELFGPTTTSQDLALQRRAALLDDERFTSDPNIQTVLTRLADPVLWSKLTRYLDFTNAKKTSNHVERRNREHRRRQRSHYRLRCMRSLWALLNTTLHQQPLPHEPVHLTRRRTISPETKEVKAS